MRGSNLDPKMAPCEQPSRCRVLGALAFWWCGLVLEHGPCPQDCAVAAKNLCVGQLSGRQRDGNSAEASQVRCETLLQSPSREHLLPSRLQASRKQRGHRPGFSRITFPSRRLAGIFGISMLDLLPNLGTGSRTLQRLGRRLSRVGCKCQDH